ncbi:MAG: hypothetical protein ACLQDY_17925, partial [Streptosporangiaceae bacterium]
MLDENKLAGPLAFSAFLLRTSEDFPGRQVHFYHGDSAAMRDIASQLKRDFNPGQFCGVLEYRVVDEGYSRGLADLDLLLIYGAPQRKAARFSKELGYHTQLKRNGPPTCIIPLDFPGTR